MDNIIRPLIISHCSPDPSYDELAPPSDGLVRKTLESMERRFDEYNRFMKDPLLIYNHPKEPDETAREYKMNLRRLSEEKGVEMDVITNHGLRRAAIHGLKKIDSPYIAFVEHDWEFKKDIDLPSLVQVFENYNKVNYVRFNKIKNRVEKADTIVIEEETEPISLCKVSTFSNNPHISRTKVFEDWVKNSKPNFRHLYRSLRTPPNLGGYDLRDIVRKLKRRLYHRQTHIKAYDDIEHFIDIRFKYRIRKRGFENAHPKMGTYLYGEKGSGPYVEHLGV